MLILLHTAKLARIKPKDLNFVEVDSLVQYQAEQHLFNEPNLDKKLDCNPVLHPEDKLKSRK
jgi:hypothetical protein